MIPDYGDPSCVTEGDTEDYPDKIRKVMEKSRSFGLPKEVVEKL